MVDDAGVLQARVLLKTLTEQVEDISRKLEIVEHRHRHRRTSARGAMLDRRQVAGLRQELYEAHRLIDGLHRRFPATNERAVQRQTSSRT